jgi:hypothetical protein
MQPRSRDRSFQPFLERINVERAVWRRQLLRAEVERFGEKVLDISEIDM